MARRGRPHRAARPGRRPATWTCPRCLRTFRQVHQRHACGVGRRDEFLAGRPERLVRLYQMLEGAARRLGGVEIVTRDRYALFRTTRIFADLVLMRDALRVVVHLARAAKDPRFFKVVPGSGGRVSHVTRVTTATELRGVLPYLAEAHALAVSESRRRT